MPEDPIVAANDSKEPPISPPERGHRWGIAKTSMFAALMDGALAMTVIILIPGALPRREVGFVLFMATYVWISFWPATALLTWGYRKKGWSSRLEFAAVVVAAPLLMLVVVFIIAIIAVS